MNTKCKFLDTSSYGNYRCGNPQCDIFLLNFPETEEDIYSCSICAYYIPGEDTQETKNDMNPIDLFSIDNAIRNCLNEVNYIRGQLSELTNQLSSAKEILFKYNQTKEPYNE